MYLQVSESVGIGHSDKVADRIADAVLDEVLSKDLNAQVACEVLATHNSIFVSGETSYVGRDLDIEKVVKDVLIELKYDPSKFKVVSNINRQSPDIRSNSIESSRGIVSGDQSIVIGYACEEQSGKLLPLSFIIATDLVKQAQKLIDTSKIEGFKYDMKSLVSLYKQNDSFFIKDIVFSIQHTPGLEREIITKDIYEKVLFPVVVERYGISLEPSMVKINSSGKFVIGGLEADTGSTNRKIIVDSYGPTVRHGGGGYSGKDLTKVDRLGAYYARWIAKNLVAAYVCKWVEVEIVYYFGAQEPLHYEVRAESKFTSEKIIKGIKAVFPQKFSDIYKLFNTGKYKFKDLSSYGHFKDGYPWEETEKVLDLKDYFGISF